MPDQVLAESQPKILNLTEAQAAALLAAGKRLASDKAWWGASEPSPDRSVIRCARLTGDEWSVTVADAVGLIAVGDLRLEVLPKIPLPHLLFLFGESGHFPRMDEPELRAAAGLSLWELVARWYLTETERLIRKDLLRDYQDAAGWLPIVRGRVDAVRTARALATGRLEALCTYEDFGADTPLNRILLEASRRLGANQALAWEHRRRALAIAGRMDGVSSLQSSDLRVKPDRRSAYYHNAIALGRHIIAGQGRSIERGPHYAWTFLIRTPEMVEAGIRNILRGRLAPEWTVTKQGRQLVGSTMTFNPDLVFDRGIAIADVKYKQMGDDWSRADLYQVIAFAVAYVSSSAALIGFRSLTPKEPRRVLVGGIEVRELLWNAMSETTPAEAVDTLVDETERWLCDVRRTRSLARNSLF
jgi:hypothetical protein